MKKNILLSIGAIGTILAPASIVISCADSDVYSIKTASYPDSLKKLAGGDITLAGAWGDAKVTVDQATKDKIKVVGVVKKRISNDGIQVRGNMNANDQRAVQMLFKDLITIANNQKAAFAAAKKANDSLTLDAYTGDKSLLITMNGKVKSVFEIYSHSDYKEIKSGDKISAYIKGEWQAGLDMLPGTIKPTTSFTSSDAEIFDTSTQVAQGATTLSTSYGYKSQKHLKIQFIPSNDPTSVKTATDKLKQFMTDAGLTGTEITVSTNYESAAKLLKDKSIDVAFLPVDAWYEQTGKPGANAANFILQAARPLQVATMDTSGTAATPAKGEIVDPNQAVNFMNEYSQLYLQDVTSAKLVANDNLGDGNWKEPQHSFHVEAQKSGTPEEKIMNYASDPNRTNNDFLASQYESFIYAKNDSAITKAIDAARQDNNDWKLKWEDQKKNIIYGFTSTTSSASMVFPIQWMQTHFDGFKGF